MKTHIKTENSWIENAILLISSTIIVYCGAIFFLLLPTLLFFTQGIVLSVFPPKADWQLLDRARVNAWEWVVMGKSSISLFTPQETSHLVDVHQLLRNFFLAAVAAALILIIRRKQLLKIFRQTYIIFLAVLSFCTLLALLLFPTFFEFFHRVFFTQGNYSFPEYSLLIQTFPFPFWLLNFALLQSTVITFLLIQLHRAPDRNI